VAQILTKLSELEDYFSRIPRKFSDITSKILKALQELQDQAKLLKEWSDDKTKLINKLASMREMNTTPSLDDSTKMILEQVLDESRQSTQVKSYTKTHVMLGMQSGYSSKAERSIANKLLLWYEHERHVSGLFSSALGSLSDLPENQLQVVKRYVFDYHHSLENGKRLVKHAQMIGRAKAFLEAKKSRQGQPSPAILEEFVEGLEKLKSMGALSQKEESILKGMKSKGDQCFTQTEVEKLAMEGFIIGTGDLPIYLQEFLTVSDCTNTKGLNLPKTTSNKSIMYLKQKAEIMRIASLPRHSPEFQDDIKIIKILKILIQADLMLLNKSERLLDRLVDLKKNQIKLAKAQYIKVEENMEVFNSIMPSSGLKKVLHRLDPNVLAYFTMTSLQR
jgi:hypothetical protein